MVLIFIALFLSVVTLVWLWKVPVKRLVEAMKRNGSTTLEAYVMIILLAGGLFLAGYLIAGIL